MCIQFTSALLANRQLFPVFVGIKYTGMFVTGNFYWQKTTTIDCPGNKNILQ
jgi:hypothetical protein